MKWRIGKRGGLARPTPESEGDHLLLLDFLHQAGCPDPELAGAMKALTGGKHDEALVAKHLRAAGIFPRRSRKEWASRKANRDIFKDIPGISDEEYAKAKARYEAEHGELEDYLGPQVRTYGSVTLDQETIDATTRQSGAFDLSEVDTVEAPQWVTDIHQAALTTGTGGVIGAREIPRPRGFAAAVESTTLAEMLRLTEDPE